ncbi:hypothetical protein IWQ62_003379, partial [Dispira parvispora]
LGLTQEEATTVRRWADSLRTDNIPYKTFDISFHRSRGPGGQNVNKVNTKVDMRFNLRKAKWIPEFVKNQLQTKEPSHTNKIGEFIITSDRTRSQANNIEDCVQKLQAMLVCAAYIPPDPSQEAIAKIAERHQQSKEKLRTTKTKRSNLKQSRRSRGDDY